MHTGIQIWRLRGRRRTAEKMRQTRDRHTDKGTDRKTDTKGGSIKSTST